MRRWVSILVVPMLLAGCGTTGALSAIDSLSIPGLPVGPTDEEQIVDILNDVQRGMESARIYKVLAHVGRNYHDQEGRDYAAMQEYLNRLFRDYRDIRITRPQPLVIVEGTRARALESFGTQARPTNPMENTPISVQGQVTVYFEKQGDAWKIVEWGPMQ